MEPHRTARVLGALAGLIAGLSVAGFSRAGRLQERPVILSESKGGLSELVIHYTPEAGALVTPVYRDLLRQLEPATKVRVVCPSHSAWRRFVAELGPARVCSVEPVLVDHPFTVWSRDRWLTLAEGPASKRVALVAPGAEEGAELWPARAGDQLLAEDLAARLPGVSARRSALLFDGGDFLADDDAVFVAPRVLRRNLQRTVETREELVQALARELNRRIILLDQAPDHHLGMFMAGVGNRVMLVADSRVPQGASLDLPPGFQSDTTGQTQVLLDAIAQQCEAAGYRVVRIPTIAGEDGRTYLTYVNSLVDDRPEGRIVYMPVYQGAETLNRLAQRVWEEAGFEVRPVDCTTVYPHFGSLHCLVNVLRRG